MINRPLAFLALFLTLLLLAVPAWGAMPTFVSCGAVGGSIGIGTPAMPAGIQTNDALLLLSESANEAVTISDQAGGTWTEVTNSPQGTGTAAAAAATRLTIHWSRYNGTQTGPIVADAGDHTVNIICAFRGIRTTGDPYNISSGGIEATSDTSVSIPGATTTAVDCLVVAISTRADDTSGAAFSGWTNSNLANVTEILDAGSTPSDGGGFGVATGEKAAAGAYGATTATLANASAKGFMTIALEGASSGDCPACRAHYYRMRRQ